ncbi:MAG: carbon storage regulator [Mycobacterium sp.]|nr:carbon storage regulator [Mycobacterium sp.]
MLIVKRRALESLQIGPDVTVTVLRTSADSVELGISAPPHMTVRRNAVRFRGLLEEPVLGCITLQATNSQKELSRRG